MELDLAALTAVTDSAAQLVVCWHGERVLNQACGWLDPDTRRRPTQTNTMFDLASVSKLFTGITFMTLVKAGMVGLEQPVGAILPEFNGARSIQPYEDPLKIGETVVVVDAAGLVNAGTVTFRHLLTHTSGLPAWRPLFQQIDASAARRMALTTFFSYPPGTRVVYSDIGLILLGITIERLTGQTLNAAVHERIIDPLGLRQTRYLPLSAPGVSLENVAPTEFCRWRGRRVVGQVHDENAYRLGGVAGHAGLFSTAADLAALGQVLLDCMTGSCGGSPLLSAETVSEMTRLHTEGLNSRRGLAFLLWQPDPESSGNPFGRRAFGHTGFTGTSLWIDPDRDLVAALLTNEIYHGRQERKILPLRINVHRAIVEAVDRA